MSHLKLKAVTDKQKRHDLADIKPGMIVKIIQKIKEGNKTRNQTIEGLVISRKHGQEIGSRITVRRIVAGVGIEWTIPSHAPNIEKVEVLKESKVRRAKLYYMRRKSQRQTRMKLKREIKALREAKIEDVEIPPQEQIAEQEA